MTPSVAGIHEADNVTWEVAGDTQRNRNGGQSIEGQKKLRKIDVIFVWAIMFSHRKKHIQTL